MSTEKTDSAPRPSAGHRVSAAIYAFERALAISATALMVATYALMVVWSNANREFNQLDLLLLKWAGYPDLAAAPADVTDRVAGLWSPLLLGVVVYGLAWLGLRTRERSSPDGEPVATRRPLWLTAVLAAVITGGLWGLVKGIAVLPSLVPCLAALAGVAAGGVVALRRQGPSVESVAGFLGAVAGAGALAWYFVSMGSEAYDWNLGLSGVLLLYIGFLGASMATHDGRHIRVDAVRKGLKGPGYHLYNALSDLLALAFTVFLGVMAVRYTAMLAEKGFLQEAARLPQWLAAFPIALAFALMSLRFAIKIAESTRSWLRREPAPELAPELH
jgi:TRAP-type C4-dicarboxylate transport system permease small subunit